MHQHERELYSEYCSLMSRVQNRILQINKIPLIEVNDEKVFWSYLSYFKEDYKKYRLGDERYFYVFLQYTPGLIDLAGQSVREVNRPMFEPVIRLPLMSLVQGYRHNIIEMIDEYVFCQNVEKYKDQLEPPMNLMWRELNMTDCDESVVMIAAAVFVIGSCYAIRKNLQVGDVFRFQLPSIHEIDTAEDLYYLLLMVLYETYLNAESR